jgi:hypothetical protein
MRTTLAVFHGTPSRRSCAPQAPIGYLRSPCISPILTGNRYLRLAAWCPDGRPPGRDIRERPARMSRTPMRTIGRVRLWPFSTAPACRRQIPIHLSNSPHHRGLGRAGPTTVVRGPARSKVRMCCSASNNLVEDARDLAERISVERKRLSPWFETAASATQVVFTRLAHFMYPSRVNPRWARSRPPHHEGWRDGEDRSKKICAHQPQTSS